MRRLSEKRLINWTRYNDRMNEPLQTDKGIYVLVLPLSKMPTMQRSGVKLIFLKGYNSFEKEWKSQSWKYAASFCQWLVLVCNQYSWLLVEFASKQTLGHTVRRGSMCFDSDDVGSGHVLVLRRRQSITR